MKTLAQLQQNFQSCVLTQDLPDVAPCWVSAGGRADPLTQVSIYNYAYRARLIEVLAKDFSAIHSAMGDEIFQELVFDYIQTHPSNYFSIRDFGSHFADFLAGHTIHGELPWLSQLAQFEWALCDAFDAADAPTLTEQDLAAISPETWPQLRFVPHPSVFCLSTDWNIPAIWKVLISENPQAPALEAQEQTWLIWREGLITRFRSLDEDEWRALACLCAGHEFEQICKVLAEFHESETVPLRAATLLKAWLGQGLLSRVTHE